jgi:hypothetical protein
MPLPLVKAVARVTMLELVMRLLVEVKLLLPVMPMPPMPPLSLTRWLMWLILLM